MFKVNIRKIIVILITVYTLIIVSTNIFYEKLLVNIIGSDEIIFNAFRNEDYSKSTTRYIVSLDGSFVNFSTVKGKAIAPLNLAYIPYVESEYTVDPNNMTSVEGFVDHYDYYNDDENIQNGVVFKGFQRYSWHGTIQSRRIHLGVTDRIIEDYPMETYSIDSVAEGKYIFMIISEEEITFDDFSDIFL